MSKKSSDYDHSVLFVCLGNICRSPMAEFVMKQIPKKKKWKIESCGTGDHFHGSSPDSRTIKVLKKNYGKNLKIDKTARGIVKSDLKNFDFLLCMDDENLEDVLSLKKKVKDCNPVIKLLADYSENYDEVPDPYYGSGGKGFENVFKMCNECITNFVKSVENKKK